jgi:hypothetical protein
MLGCGNVHVPAARHMFSCSEHVGAVFHSCFGQVACLTCAGKRNAAMCYRLATSLAPISLESLISLFTVINRVVLEISSLMSLFSRVVDHWLVCRFTRLS